MSTTPTIIAISGSTRNGSTNHQLINAIQNIYKNEVTITLFEGLAELPHFNPDLDTVHAPQKVIDFRNQLKAADGILICTPEYAMGVPGTLKNAIDWTVSSMEFSHKPVALITASSSGEKGHSALMATLQVIESDITEDTQLLISFVKTKVKDNIIIDLVTLEQVKVVINALLKLMQRD